LDLPIRKNIRLRDYDYSQGGVYFITICTKNKNPILWDSNVGTTIGRPPLSIQGQIVDNAVNGIQTIYPSAEIDKYVIMPNHVHLLIRLFDNDWQATTVTKISMIIQNFKGYVCKQIGAKIWQARFYDHIIRNEQDYLACWKYIDENPLKWQDDELFEE
jgi:REP element-mobilizing transposase RayT